MQLSRHVLTSAEERGRIIFLFLFLMQTIVPYSAGRDPSSWQWQLIVVGCHHAGHVCLGCLCLEKATMKSLTLAIVVQLLSGYHSCMEQISYRPRFLRTSRQNSHFSHFSHFPISLIHLGVWRLRLYLQMYHGRSRQAMRTVRVLNPIIFQCEKHKRFIELERKKSLAYISQLSHQIITS